MNKEAENKLMAALDREVFRRVGQVADSMGRECYLVGGAVRDILLDRPSKDFDFVTVGSGIDVARAVAASYGRKHAHLSVFKTYGTAQVKLADGTELEFVGARRESYRRESRNPIVEDGTLDDDLTRRDFTVNALAASVNAATFGKLIDKFHGLDDMERGIIRTPRDPNVTFDDDPLRMMRAVRFATQLGFDIHPETLAGITRNARRISIITHERIADELMKIMRSSTPSRGFALLNEVGLLKPILPEVNSLKGVDNSHGRGHKDNFLHTMQVLDNVAAASDNEWLRWAALLHDIGKPATKRWDDQQGWTFHNHNYVGEKMVPKIFARLRLPMGEPMKYVKKLVGLHMRPIALVEDEVTDSAVRRLLFDAGDDIDDLMILCKADITSKNPAKVQRFRDNYDLVKRKLVDIEEKDRVRNFQPPVDGEEIMATFGLPPSLPVGQIKDAIKDAILDGVIANNYADAYRLMMRRAAELSIASVTAGVLCHTSIDSPIGLITLAASDEGLLMVNMGDASGNIESLARALHLTIAERVTPLLQHAVSQLGDYFDGKLQHFALPLCAHGTDFQHKVWEALTDVPFGTTASYKQIAEQVGKPRSSRAVAQACNANPHAIVVPCHRIIAADGSTHGYAYGTHVKQWLLNHEKAVAERIALNSEQQI